ncbi:DUF5684 domain-containing protein [Leucobacter japonicus]|uniref:DUF5684 domain-containing protein n=1 Tax=Leucobacter japonicus TaxID=1461259 RepID=UPI0006A7EE63|nr:DUF5684 domain-containing protein [Leucobacter japonicus]
MDYETSTQLGAGFFLVFGIWSLVGLAFYVWYLWALSRLFPYLGLPSGWGWIPVWNQWQLVQRGGLPGWLVLLGFIPGLSIVVLVVSIIAIHRINSEFGKGAGFTVLGAFIPPLWATLFGSQLRDREYGDQGYPVGGYDSAYPGAAASGATGYGAEATPGYGGFAPQGAADSAAFGAQQPDPAWQGLPPVTQAPAPAQPQVAADPWAAPQVPAAPQQPASGYPAPTADPWAQPAQAAQPAVPPAPGAPASGGLFGAPAEPAPAQPQAPEPNNWGFSNTTEGDYARLAAEGHTPAAPAPLGGVAAPQPFSWPAVQESNVEGESGPLILPEPPASVVPAVPAAPAVEPPAPSYPTLATASSAPESQTPLASEPQTPQTPQTPEPSIFDRETPAAPAIGLAPAAPVTAEPPVIPAAPEPAAAPVAFEPAAAVAPAPVAPAPTPDAGGLDEDHTVVVSRRARWGIELPDGETLELVGDDVIVGRKPEPRDGATVLQITDPTRTMSKSHARLRRDGEEWTIEDLQSTNGVALVDAGGTTTSLEPGRIAPATEQLVIGTLQVRLHQLG